MRWLFAVLLLVVGYTVGLASSSIVRPIVAGFTGGQLQCVRSEVCVGGPESDVRKVNMDWIGGLEAISCAPASEGGMATFLSFPEFLTKACGNEPVYWFNNGIEITQIVIKNGKIAEIRRGPLHVLDL
jgi:hypothetical protein